MSCSRTRYGILGLGSRICSLATLQVLFGDMAPARHGRPMGEYPLLIFIFLNILDNARPSPEGGRVSMDGKYVAFVGEVLLR